MFVYTTIFFNIQLVRILILTGMLKENIKSQWLIRPGRLLPINQLFDISDKQIN